MAREQWHEQLEAYLDGELAPEAAEAFAAETAADPELVARLQEREALRLSAKKALGEGLPPDLVELARGLGRTAKPAAETRRDRHWTALAVAAALTLAILAPSLLRNIPGAAGPRSNFTTGGSVSAVRFGESPDATVDLEAGCYHLATGTCR